MSVPYYGDFAEDDTVLIPFNTFDSNDPQASATITNLVDADIMVHKDGGTTQIATDGATVAIDYDTITGNHLITIDTSVHADYAAGSEYAVRIEGTTVDAGTINAWVGTFSIERAGGVLALIKAGNLGANVTQWNSVSLGTTNPLPNAAPDAAGGLVISDAGGLDIDTLLGTLTSLAAEDHDANIRDQIKRVISIVESQRGAHTHQAQGDIFYVDPVNGGTHAGGNRGGVTDPYSLVQDCHDNAVTDSNHDCIILLAGAAAGVTTLTEDVTLSKRYLMIRGPGRDFIWTRSGNGDTISITADGLELSGFQLETAATGSGSGVQATGADFLRVHNVWINATRGDGINLLRCDNCQIHDNTFTDTGQSGSGQGMHIVGTAGTSNRNHIYDNTFHQPAGDGVLIENGTTNQSSLHHNTFEGCAGYGVNIGASSTDAFLSENHYGGNVSGAVNDAGTDTIRTMDEEPAKHSIATETRLAELDAANIPADIDKIPLSDGTNTWNATALASINAEADTAISDAALATAAALATVDTEVGLIQADLDNGTDGLGALLAAINAVMTTQMTESYATDGTAPTPTEALMLIQQHLTAFAISGTTWTTKKVDGSTTAGTFTLDDGTSPTSITRAT